MRTNHFTLERAVLPFTIFGISEEFWVPARKDSALKYFIVHVTETFFQIVDSVEITRRWLSLNRFYVRLY